MKKEDFLARAANPELIPGIYNYCDRWCERCPMTSRCLNYMTLLEDGALEPGVNDMQNEAFWEKIHDSFQLTMELLQDMAEKQGIDLTQTEEEKEAIIREHDQQREEVKKSPLSELAMQYLTIGKKWLDNSEDHLLRKEEELNCTIRMGLHSMNPHAEATSIKEAIEVACYYLMQIYVKLARAQGGKKHSSWEEKDDDFPKDSDGSAKVALISIDRSISAWGILLRSFSEEESEILPLLSMLERLRAMAEKEFPDARGFVRAGFDEEHRA